MGIYYKTYIFKGSPQQSIEFSNTLVVNKNQPPVAFYSPILTIGTIDPVLDADEKNRGYVTMDEFKRFIRAHPTYEAEVEKWGEEDVNVYFCEVVWCSMDNPNTLNTVTLLPVQ